MTTVTQWKMTPKEWKRGPGQGLRHERKRHQEVLDDNQRKTTAKEHRRGLGWRMNDLEKQRSCFISFSLKNMLDNNRDTQRKRSTKECRQGLGYCTNKNREVFLSFFFFFALKIYYKSTTATRLSTTTKNDDKKALVVYIIVHYIVYYIY